MIELIEYNELGKLNAALQQFGKNPDIKVRKVKLLTVGEAIRFYALIEYGSNSYQTDKTE